MERDYPRRFRNRRNLRIIVRWILFLSWLGVAVFLSGQPGNGSGLISNNVAKTVVKILSVFGYKLKSYSKFHSDVREFAHFFLHFMLALFAYRAFSVVVSRFRIALFVSLLFSCITAFMDELFQLFAQGRVFELTDLRLNLFGVMAGTLISLLITRTPRLEYRQPKRTPW